MQTVNVKLPSSAGVTMAASIDFPSSPPLAYAVFAHGFARTRQTPAPSRISKRLTDYGIATLRFDFPGMGQSEGDLADSSFSENAEDIKAAHAWMAENYAAPQLLLGHSLGGAAALKAATEMKDLRAVATVGAPFDPAHSVLHYADTIGEVDEHGAQPVRLGGQDLTISRQFLEDLAETNPEAYLPLLRKPLLLVHSPIDETVGIDNAQTIYQVTRYPKSLVSLDKGDHHLTRPGSAVAAADIIGTWARPYLVPDNPVSPMERDQVESSTARGVRFGDVVRTPFGDLDTDRARTSGRPKGHTPQELLMAALAAETSQTIRAAAKGMKLDDVHVRINHVHEETFERHIRYFGELSDSERATLHRAANSTKIEAMLGKANIMDVGQ